MLEGQVWKSVDVEVYRSTDPIKHYHDGDESEE
jgi:hypothetical protein